MNFYVSAYDIINDEAEKLQRWPRGGIVMMKLLTNRAVKLGLVTVIFSAQTLAFASTTRPEAGPAAPAPITTPNRSIFLNGIDISSARSQDLRNVHIKISETGDIFISAPQYQVTEEETFLPLSSYTTKQVTPEHKSPQAMGTGTGAGTGSAAVAKAPIEGSVAEKSSEKATEKSSEKLPTKSANPPSTPVINAAPGANSATSPSQPASAAAPKSGG